MKHKTAAFTESVGYSPLWKTASRFLTPLPRLVDGVCEVFRNGEFRRFFLLNTEECQERP